MIMDVLIFILFLMIVLLLILNGLSYSTGYYQGVNYTVTSIRKALDKLNNSEITVEIINQNYPVVL